MSDIEELKKEICDMIEKLDDEGINYLINFLEENGYKTK